MSLLLLLGKFLQLQVSLVLLLLLYFVWCTLPTWTQLLSYYQVCSCPEEQRVVFVRWNPYNNVSTIQERMGGTPSLVSTDPFDWVKLVDEITCGLLSFLFTKVRVFVYFTLTSDYVKDFAKSRGSWFFYPYPPATSTHKECNVSLYLLYRLY